MRIYLMILSIVLPALYINNSQSSQNQSTNLAQIDSIHATINRWHLAASNADFDAFFNCMDSEAVYIGTDESEKWNRDEFMAFCKPYFDRGSAWDFKPFDRKVYLNKQADLAWFDEKLDTWMGICRSSGVIVKLGNDWKIKHYQLSVTVPNEIVNDFIEMIKNYKSNPKNN